MSEENEYKKKTSLLTSKQGLEDETGETGESGEAGGTGGKSGQIEFRDFLAAGEGKREDLLTEDEKKRLLSVHGDLNESNVKKGKDKRDQYKALKEGKVTLAAHRQGVGNGMNGKFPNHPLLSDKAQFSGIDEQLNPSANENKADTNNELRAELENSYDLQHELQHRLANRPSSAPKPSPFNR